jgi:hypothetical protein
VFTAVVAKEQGRKPLVGKSASNSIYGRGVLAYWVALSAENSRGLMKKFRKRNVDVDLKLSKYCMLVTNLPVIIIKSILAKYCMMVNDRLFVGAVRAVQVFAHQRSLAGIITSTFLFTSLSLVMSEISLTSDTITN